MQYLLNSHPQWFLTISNFTPIKYLLTIDLNLINIHRLKLKRSLILKAGKSKTKIIWWGWIFCMTLIREKTFPSIISTTVAIHLSGPHELHCRITGCGRIIGEDLPWFGKGSALISLSQHFNGSTNHGIQQEHCPEFNLQRNPIIQGGLLANYCG